MNGGSFCLFCLVLFFVKGLCLLCGMGLSLLVGPLCWAVYVAAFQLLILDLNGSPKYNSIKRKTSNSKPYY